MDRSPSLARRQFLQYGGSCSAYLLALTSFAPVAVKRVFQQPQANEKLFEQKWGWIEKLSENVWSHIATPFDGGEFTTVCNGGIIAGRERVLAVESFMKPEGAKWLAQRCQELTGRWPTDVVVTHYHADHVSGSSGYQSESGAPTMWVTETTRDLIKDGAAAGDAVPLLDRLSVIQGTTSTELDLGGTVVQLNPMAGHTRSDVVVEVKDPAIVFTGDLFFHRLVPNFLDASPRQLDESVTALLRDKATRYVPGHGTMASLQDLKLFQQFLAMLQQAASQAHGAGKSADEAADEFQLRGKFADWYVFADTVIPRVFHAWYRELNNQ